MIPGNISMLIKEIILKTNSKQAIWGKTSRENEFKLLFEKGAVTTDNWLNDNGVDTVDFGIYNSFGEKIDYFTAKRAETDYELLILLHSTAKREFFRVDETISILFNEVKADKSIGKREIEGEW